MNIDETTAEGYVQQWDDEGEWLVFYPWRKGAAESFTTFEAALSRGRNLVTEYDSQERPDPIDITICWKCGDHDPRIGREGFQTVRPVGRFNQFGDFVERS